MRQMLLSKYKILPNPPPTAITQTVIFGASAAAKRLMKAPIPPTMATARSPTLCEMKWFGRAETIRKLVRKRLHMATKQDLHTYIISSRP